MLFYSRNFVFVKRGASIPFCECVHIHTSQQKWELPPFRILTNICCHILHFPHWHRVRLYPVVLIYSSLINNEVETLLYVYWLLKFPYLFISFAQFSFWVFSYIFKIPISIPYQFLNLQMHSDFCCCCCWRKSSTGCDQPLAHSWTWAIGGAPLPLRCFGMCGLPGFPASRSCPKDIALR